MILPKNAITTHPISVQVRKGYRRGVKQTVVDNLARTRTFSPSFERKANLPSFLVVGAQKAGTTGIFQGLTELSGVGKPMVKEVRYFNRWHSARSQNWYAAHFWGDADLLWGEATPEYFDHLVAPNRVLSMLPHVKIIVSLRDPIARAVSHYFHSRDFGYEKRSMPEALAAELDSLKVGKWMQGRELEQHGYISRSLYSRSLVSWLSTFPREQVLVVIAERPVPSLMAAAEFVGSTTQRVENASYIRANARTYSPPSDEIIDKLAVHIAPDLAYLSELLGWNSLPQEWMASSTIV